MPLTKATQNVVEGIVSTGSTGVSAGSFVVGQQYKITSLGTTTQGQWNTIAGTTGQTYVVGSLFTAVTTGSSSGNGAAAVARTLADRFSDVVNAKDYGVLSNGTDETTKVQNAANNQSAGELLFIPSNTRHSVKLSDDYQLGVDNRYTSNINISSFSNCYNANVSGKNYDKHIYLFGDSHGWGQGAPEWDTFSGVTNWSRYSSTLFNTGFQARIEEYINWKNNVDDKLYTLNFPTNGLRYNKNNYLSNSEKKSDFLLSHSRNQMKEVQTNIMIV
jgi:hypothetical protein